MITYLIGTKEQIEKIRKDAESRFRMEEEHREFLFRYIQKQIVDHDEEEQLASSGTPLISPQTASERIARSDSEQKRRRKETRKKKKTGQ